MSNEKESIFDFGLGKRIRELLENFSVISTMRHIALVPKRDGGSVSLNVRSAIVASTLGLASIDYARRRYVDSQCERTSEYNQKDAYIDAYQASKLYMARLVDKLTTSGRPEPSVGIFGASLVLERLSTSFFSAHFLYQIGNRYEGHAVARLILEQIAWAFNAFEFDDMDDIKRIGATRSITTLKRFVPFVGRLYGFLSEKTHIDYSSHAEFLRIEEGQNCVLHTQLNYEEYAIVIMQLADLFGIVWELSQASYIAETEAIVRMSANEQYRPNPNRPFLEVMEKSIENVRTASRH